MRISEALLQDMAKEGMRTETKATRPRDSAVRLFAEAGNIGWNQGKRVKARCRGKGSEEQSLVRAQRGRRDFVATVAIARKIHQSESPAADWPAGLKNGGRYRTRTCDPVRVKHVL
jgi:hypothetical protein